MSSRDDASFEDPDESAHGAAPPAPYSRSGASVAALFAALPFAAMGGAPVLAPMVAIAGVLGAPRRRAFHALKSGGLALALGAAFVAWAGVSALWSADAGAVRAAVLLVVTAAGGLLFALAAGRLAPTGRRLAKRAAAAGLALLFAFVSAEAWMNFPIGRVLAEHQSVAAELPAPSQEADAALFIDDAQLAVSIALICVGGAAALAAPFGLRGAPVIVLLIGASGSLSLAFGSPNNIIAFTCGVLAALIALKWPRATVSILGQVVAGWIVIAPILMPLFADLATQAFKLATGVEAPFAWQARAESWAYIAAKAREHLLWGWGLGASGHFADTYSLLGFTLPYVPRHPHNASLQIWLETGAIGAMLSAGALASFGRRAGAALANDRWAAAAAASALATAAVLANVSAGAWSLWWWAAIAVGAGLVRLTRRSA